ncbi:MAG: HPP family protein [Peptococcus niger]
MEVSNIMEKEVYFVTTAADVAETMRYMVDKNISGVPILDEAHRLAGFVSDGDLMAYLFKLGKRHDPLFAESLAALTDHDLEKNKALTEELQNTKVLSLATRKVITVQEHDTCEEACRFLGKKQIKKMPVVDTDNRVVGVLSRSTVVRYLYDHLTGQAAHGTDAASTN